LRRGPDAEVDRADEEPASVVEPVDI